MTKIGLRGEDIAAKFLKEKGYYILYRNYKTPYGEADIIAKDNDTVVFVEVKTRSNLSFGYPFESVNLKKQERLKRIALNYLKVANYPTKIRFDVISISSENGLSKIEHIKEAF